MSVEQGKAKWKALLHAVDDIPSSVPNSDARLLSTDAWKALMRSSDEPSQPPLADSKAHFDEAKGNVKHWITYSDEHRQLPVRESLNKAKKKDSSDMQSRLADAIITRFTHGAGISWGEIARIHGVAMTTAKERFRLYEASVEVLMKLANRDAIKQGILDAFADAKCVAASLDKRRFLTIEEENRLVEEIILSWKMYKPLGALDVKLRARQIAQQRLDPTHRTTVSLPGKKWLAAFEKRHSAVINKGNYCCELQKQ
jgi:hypothetical protein